MAASFPGSTLASGLTHSGFHSACLNWALVPSLSTDNKTDSSTTTPDPLFHYSQALSSPLPAKFMELHANSVQHYPATANKTVSDLQGQFLRLLMRMTRPRRVLELGCFMGYSAMAMADGMASNGVLYTCEKDTQAAQLARELFDKQGYIGKSGKATIELLEGDAMASLETLAKNQLQFDAIFIDADKGGYIKYFEHIMDNGLLSKDGYILADNILFRGMVLNSNTSGLPSPPPSPTLSPTDEEASKKRSKSSLQKTANHMDAFNRHVRSDPRVEVVVLPVFDGLSVIMHKSTYAAGSEKFSGHLDEANTDKGGFV
ncbi:hypothetical protein BG006_001932 [Podila minutissima]|uniref:O-methyltransferase n=1 Tax=Podila minutissima TaxID=64525 RepID=A0A9P5SR79_9FUNG|nr:hypothetical protein BG006_001932 [Podila minutissima]